MRHVSFDIVLVVALAVAPAAFAAGMDSKAQFGVTEPASGNIVGPAGDIKLADAISYAIAHSPVLRVAQAEVDASTGAVTQAGLLPNPVVSMEVEDTRRSTRKTSVLIGMPLELHGQRRARTSAAESGAAVARAELDNTRTDLRVAVTQAFFDVVAAQERVTLAQSAFDVAKKATEIAGKRVAAGKVPPLDETRANVAQANSAVDIADANAELDAARTALSATWGSNSPGFVKAVADVTDFPERPTWPMLEKRLSQAPQLVVARAEVAKRQALTSLEESRQHIVPTLNLGSKRDQEVGRTAVVIGVSLPLPLFDRNQGNIAAAMNQTDKAQAMLEATEARLSSDLKRASAKLNAARESSQAMTSTVLPGAELAYRSATRGFEAGKFSFLDVLDAQRTYFQARIQYLQILINANLAAATIDRILGT